MNKIFKPTGLLGVFTACVFLSLTSCGGTAQDNKEDGTTELIETENIVIDDSPIATNVSFTNLQGDKVDVESLRGKVVFINFWATWCPPCIREMPSIQTLKENFDGNSDIEFLLVDVDNDIDNANAFMKEHDFDLPLYVPASDIPSDFLAGVIPTTVIIDKEGKMVTRLEGGRDYADQEMIDSITELVNQ